ncbi:hypothetical protein [Halobacteriovorax sp. HLS]|uniref:hypothetical protein n=1 Tax=Halobacteriovorax sp. HLS TaxID=2234000 RepID=UPI000FD7290A|nr:hypothetical protein [Halobacteriovorax sp. HLS]
MKPHTLFFTLLLTLLLNLNAFAKVSLVLPLVDGWAHQTEKSYAPEAINRVTKGNFNNNIKLVFRPFKRALTDFEKKKYNCFVGGDEKTMKDFANVETISSKMIRNTSLRAYTLKGHPKIVTQESIKDKEVVYVRGLDLSSLELDLSKTKTSSVNDVKQAVKIMKAQRATVFLHWFPSTPEVMQDFHNSHSVILYTIKEKVNCHNTPENRKFISELNKKIDYFKSQGGLEKLHTDFYGDLPFVH